MGDLIDKQKVIDICNRAIDLLNGELGTWAMTAVRDWVVNLPSAKPEYTLETAIDFLLSIGWLQEHDRILTESAQTDVIRCKDCRYYKTYQYVNGIRKFLPKCSFNDIYVAEEDFCSQAERRKQ